DAPALHGGDEAGDAGRLAVVRGGQQHVVDPADGLAVGVQQRQADHLGDVDDRPRHAGNLPARYAKSPDRSSSSMRLPAGSRVKPRPPPNRSSPGVNSAPAAASRSISAAKSSTTSATWAEGCGRPSRSATWICVCASTSSQAPLGSSTAGLPMRRRPSTPPQNESAASVPPGGTTTFTWWIRGTRLTLRGRLRGQQEVVVGVEDGEVAVPLADHALDDKSGAAVD